MPTLKWGWCGAVAVAISVCAALSAPAAADGRNGNGGGGYAAAEPTYSTVVFSGVDVTRNSDEYYSGAYYAFNRDLGRDGFVARVLASRGFYQYDFSDPANPDVREVHANYWTGDVLVGYQWVRGGVDIAALIGAEYQDHRLSFPDTSNPLHGTEWGFKVAAHIESNGNDNSPWYYLLSGSYSTAFDNYYALGRIGHKRGRFTIGPEAWALGDETGDAQRVGAFIGWDFSIGRDTTGNVSFSVGHQFADDHHGGGFEGGGRNFDEGTYATMRMWLAFK